MVNFGANKQEAPLNANADVHVKRGAFAQIAYEAPKPVGTHEELASP